MAAIRMALLTIRLVMRTKAALFFTFLFPLVFLFVYAGLFAHGNPQAVAYMFGPVVTLNIMGSGFWGLGLQSVMQRERGSLRRYRLAPIGSGTIVASNLLANYLLELPTIGLLVFCAVVFFHMPLKINLLTLLILVTVGTFAFGGFGLIIASLANTMQEAQIYNNLAWLTLLFLSGTTIPLPLLPHWVQRLATFLPATYLVSSFQAVMIQSQPLFENWPALLALIVSGVFGVLFAWKVFRWEKEERIPTDRKLWALVFVIPFLMMGAWMNARANPTTSWAMTYFLVDRATQGAGEAPKARSDYAIEDFEGLRAPENLLERWRVSTDPQSAGHSMAEISLAASGAAGTEHAMRLQGHLAPGLKTDRASVVASSSLTLPAERKDVTGIEFWVRGNSHLYQINIRPSSVAIMGHPSIALVPTEEWQSVRLPVAWLSGREGANAPSSPWLLEIVVAGPPDEFSLEIDEIKFY